MARSFLTVTSAAADPALLTIAELCAAVGVEVGSQDDALLAMGARVAASIMSECNIAIAPGKAPTLMQETLSETFYSVRRESLILSRRHDVEISSLTVDGTVLAVDEYISNAESGIIYRLSNDRPVPWFARKIVAVYKAGFATIPGDLKQAAIDFFRVTWLESSRDPLVKSERTDVPGVMETERQYWVGAVPGQSSEGAVPDVVAGQLKRFRNYRIG